MSDLNAASLSAPLNPTPVRSLTSKAAALFLDEKSVSLPAEASSHPANVKYKIFLLLFFFPFFSPQSCSPQS